MNRCSLCPNKYKCISPDGPEDSPILFIGEAPGSFEEKEGRPFVGKTGKEVNEHYLPIAGLRRQACRFDNSIRCLPDRPKGRLDLNRPKDRELLETCAGEGYLSELEPSRYKLIVPMGALACHSLDPDINLELQHGIPIETYWGTVFPMYHPAGGLHEPKKMLHIRNDFVQLGRYIKGKLPLREDQYASQYNVVSADELLEVYLECNDYSRPLACDTESNRFGQPFCLTFSDSKGTGQLIRAEDKDSLEIFQLMLNQWTGPILFHNWLYDEGVTIKMGLKFPRERIVDTMVWSYQLGNLPQGLKALAYRLLGMKMQDFDDLVTPYSTPLCLEYLRKAMDMDWPKPEEQLVRDETGELKLYKPQSMNTKFKRFLTDFNKNPNLDIYQRWDNWEDSHPQIESLMGPWPGKDIRYAPIDKVIHYACRDADATLRLYLVLKSMTRQMRRTLQEHWSD